MLLLTVAGPGPRAVGGAVRRRRVVRVRADRGAPSLDTDIACAAAVATQPGDGDVVPARARDGTTGDNHSVIVAVTAGTAGALHGDASRAGGLNAVCVGNIDAVVVYAAPSGIAARAGD